MKPIRFTAFLLSSLLCFAWACPTYAAWEDTAYEQAKNLIENPGFENGLTGWDVDLSGYVDSGAAYSGNYGLQLNQGDTLTQEISIPRPGPYEFCCNFITGDSDLVLISLRYIAKDGTNEFFDNVYSEDNVWHKSCQSLYLQSDGTLELTIVANTSYDIAIDDISLSPTESLGVPLPTATNLIPNSGFEDGITGWSNSSDTTWENTSYTGKHSLGIHKTAARCTFPMLNDGTYEITAYVKSIENTEVTLSTNVILQYYSVPIEAGVWTKLSFITKVNVSISVNGITLNQITIGSGGVQLYIDDVSVVPLHSEAQSVNLLQNPSFETALNTWQEHGDPCAFTTDSVFYRGSNAACFSYFHSSPFESYISQDIAAAGEGTYTFYAYMKPDNSLSGSGGMLELEAKDAGGNVLKSARSRCISYHARGWQRANVLLNAPAGTVTITAKIGGINCTGAFYVDSAILGIVE